MNEYLPQGYKEIVEKNISFIIKEDILPYWTEISRHCFFNSSSLKKTPLSGGRNEIYLYHLAENLQIIMKLYSHGGIYRISPLKYFFFTNRFLHEFYFYLHYLKNSLPVPEYLGGWWTKKFGLYQCGVITQYIPNSCNLESFLMDTLIPIQEKENILVRCGKIIKMMHDEGIFHNDLQIRNILVNKQDRTVFLIDFDNAKKLSTLSHFHRSQNLLRLKRSFIKRQIDLTFFNYLLKGYNMPYFSFWAQTLSLPHIQWTYIKSHFLTTKPKNNKT